MDNKTIYVLLILIVGVFVFKPELLNNLPGMQNTVLSPETPIGACTNNTCSGTFTGVTDDKGCELYGIELCSIETECKSIGGQRICTPQPYASGCTWETQTDIGKTYFTKLDKCGLKAEDACGKITSYKCTTDTNTLCNINYTKPTGKFVKACGGWA